MSVSNISSYPNHLYPLNSSVSYSISFSESALSTYHRLISVCPAVFPVVIDSVINIGSEYRKSAGMFSSYIHSRSTAIPGCSSFST